MPEQTPGEFGRAYNLFIVKDDKLKAVWRRLFSLHLCGIFGHRSTG